MLPKGVVVYRIEGALFFGAAAKAMSEIEMVGPHIRVLIIDISVVPVMDATGLVALESAMERLQKGDKDAGIERHPVSDAQKAAIGEARNFYEAKLAEQEVLHHSRLRATLDPAERATIEEQYRRDRERLSSERESKIEKIRRGEVPP